MLMHRVLGHGGERLSPSQCLGALVHTPDAGDVPVLYASLGKDDCVLVPHPCAPRNMPSEMPEPSPYLPHNRHGFWPSPLHGAQPNTFFDIHESMSALLRGEQWPKPSHVLDVWYGGQDSRLSDKPFGLVGLCKTRKSRPLRTRRPLRRRAGSGRLSGIIAQRLIGYQVTHTL